MAFEGALEDLTVVDVLQLLHVSQKTGVLLVFHAGAKAQIVLEEGRIVGCRHPESSRHIGQLLVEIGAATQGEVERALHTQQAAAERRRPLMNTMVEMGLIQRSDGWRALEKLIEDTVVELVGWEEGHFVFELGEIASFDAFRHLPETVDTGMSVDTQRALMEAVRILDERNREKAQPREAGGSSDTENSEPRESASGIVTAQPKREETYVADSGGCKGESVLPGGTTAAGGEDQGGLGALIGERLEGPWQERETQRVALFSPDGLLKMSMRTVCVEHGFDLFVSEVSKDLLEKLDEWKGADTLPPALICDSGGRPDDAAWERTCLRVLDRCRVRHGEVSVVCLCGADIDCFARGFALGAAAMLPRPNTDLPRGEYVDEMRRLYAATTSCLKAIFSRRSELAERLTSSHRRMRDLKRRIREVRYPDGPSQISLVVLRHVAEYVERCVLFLVRKTDLLALGAFGLDDFAETISSAITRLRVPIEDGTVLSRAVESGQFYCGKGGDPQLRKHLYGSIGAPAHPELVLLPLRTRDRTAAVIYGDFGSQKRELIDTDALEVLADHAGMAFELALAQRR